MERYVIYADGVRIGHAETNKKAWEMANEYVYECMSQAERRCPEMEVFYDAEVFKNLSVMYAKQHERIINEKGELKVSKKDTCNTMKVINNLIYALSKTIENGEFANALEMAIEMRKYDDNDKQEVLEAIENSRFVFDFAFGFLDRVEPCDVTRRRRKRARQRRKWSRKDYDEVAKKIEDGFKDIFNDVFLEDLCNEIPDCIKRFVDAGGTKQEILESIENGEFFHDVFKGIFKRLANEM